MRPFMYKGGQVCGGQNPDQSFFRPLLFHCIPVIKSLIQKKINGLLGTVPLPLGSISVIDKHNDNIRKFPCHLIGRIPVTGAGGTDFRVRQGNQGVKSQMENPVIKAVRFAKKAKEIIRYQKIALLRSKDTIRRQEKELNIVNALLSRMLLSEKETIVDNQINMAEKLKPLIMEVTGLDEENAEVMALFVTGFAGLSDDVTRATVKPFITHCVEEIVAYLKQGTLPDWIVNDAMENPNRAKA